MRYLPYALAAFGVIAAKRIAATAVALCIVPLVILAVFEGASLVIQPTQGRPCVPSKYNFIPFLNTDKLDVQKFDHKSIMGSQMMAATCNGSPLPIWNVTPIGPLRPEG